MSRSIDDLDTDQYRIAPGAKIDLADHASRVDGGFDKDTARDATKSLRLRLQELQRVFFADRRFAMLVVLQAMDTAGKDSTIRSVFRPLNPQGCRVYAFGVPTEEEREHDFLWRVHRRAPRRGFINVFNRSHYEDVLVVRVKELVPKRQWQARYDHINAFEQLLADENTVIVKFFLHISKQYQKRRLQRRLDRPDKHWKFNPADLQDRALWNDYQRAYADAISRCSTKRAPWYVIPAERRWYRDLVIATVMREKLEGLDLRYPEPDFDPKAYAIE